MKRVRLTIKFYHTFIKAPADYRKGIRRLTNYGSPEGHRGEELKTMKMKNPRFVDPNHLSILRHLLRSWMIMKS
jgi:hypothetical protein